MFSKARIFTAVFSCLISFSTYAEPKDPNICATTIKVLMVDAYSSGRLIPPAMKEYVKKHSPQSEIEFSHIHSNVAPIPLMKPTFYSENFKSDYSHDDTLSGPSYERLLEHVKEMGPQVVIPGTESGVLLADKLSSDLQGSLKVLTNGFLMARRDKYLMAEKLRAAGLRAVKQYLAKDVEDAMKWVRENKLFPGKVVVKPTMSAGTDGVHFARNEQEFREYFGKLIGSKNQWGILNESVLVQEFLEGPEYVVNTTSLNGVHKINDIWLYNKIEVDGAGAIYDHDWLLPYEGEVQKQLVDYNLQVLDVLGIKHGWGHAEIKMTKEGPVLVEIGARMMGSGQPRIVKDALGVSQVETGVEAFLDFINPGEFYKRPQGYKLEKSAAVVNINSKEVGTFSAQLEEKIKSLPGYVRHSFFFKDGEATPKTVDMNTALGQVEFAYPNANIIKNNIKLIRLWEKQGLFNKK